MICSIFYGGITCLHEYLHGHAGIITLSQTHVDEPCRLHHNLTLTCACILPWLTDAILHALQLLIMAHLSSAVIIKNNAMQETSVVAQEGPPDLVHWR